MLSTAWKHVFDAIWPKHRGEIDLAVRNLQKHVNLIRSNANVLEIQDARKARNEARDYFKRTFASQEQESFVSLKGRVAAELYDEKLDRFRNRTVANCAEWLFQNDGFIEWLDSTKKSVSWFWLQGIPGSGKTYLAAAAIDHTKQHHRTLFAFASSLNKNNLTALSVIQTFIFQAADADREFQSLLIESKERELKGNTGHAAGILKSYIQMANGLTYIVMDGLDEMDEDERRILLRQLDDLAKHCKDLRLLISSRAEDDISRALRETAISVQVNEQNGASIKTYVNHRLNDWLARHDVDTDAKREIRDFVSPLSEKADGKMRLIPCVHVTNRSEPCADAPRLIL